METVEQPWRWQPGQSGNPKGRRVGVRDKIGRKLLEDLQKHWRKHGTRAIEMAQEHNPAKFLQIMVSILPRDVTINLDVSNEFIEALKIINARRRDRESLGQVIDGRAGLGQDLLGSDTGALASPGSDDD